MTGATLHEARVTGMDCSSCAATVRARVGSVGGVEDVEVDFATGQLRWRGGEVDAVLEVVRAAGYGASRASDPVAHAPPWREPRLPHAAAGATLLAAAFAARLAGPDGAALVLELAALALAAPPALRGALAALRARRIDMNLLMVVAAVGAVPIGAAGEGATVLVLFALGTGLEELARSRARDAVRRLLDDQPQTARAVLRSGTVEVPAAQIPVGGLIEVLPGERIPLDGTVTAGTSAVDSSALTGESVPADVEPGSAVYAGTTNHAGLLRVRATRPATDSTLVELVRLTERAQANRGHTERVVDRFARIYTPLVLVLALAVAVLPPLPAGGDWETWLYRALALLIVACPCALVISTPVAIVSGLAGIARRGALVKDGATLERLATIRTVALDKTGTLTAGQPILVETIALDGTPPADALALAAVLARHSTHPLSRALAGVPPATDVCVSDGAEQAGLGIAAEIDGHRALLGSLRLLERDGVSIEHLATHLARAAARGASVVALAHAGRPVALFLLADEPRPDAAAAIAELHAVGARVAVLSGDRTAAVSRVATGLGIDDARAELLPAEKLAAISALRAEHGPVAMIGDGTNDAPALAAADVGIAMRRGTGIALDTADVALLSDRLSHIALLLRHARRSRRTIRQNIAISLATKGALVVLAPLGHVALWLAVVGDMGISLLVTLWSLRLLAPASGSALALARQRRPRLRVPIRSAGTVRAVVRRMGGRSGGGG